MLLIDDSHHLQRLEISISSKKWGLWVDKEMLKALKISLLPEITNMILRDI